MGGLWTFTQPEVDLMSKMLTAVVCGCLIVALAIPAYAGGAPGRSTVSQVGGTVYTGGEQLLYGTGVLVDGCLNDIFSLFNTCLGSCNRVAQPLCFLRSIRALCTLKMPYTNNSREKRPQRHPRPGKQPFKSNQRGRKKGTAKGDLILGLA